MKWSVTACRLVTKFIKQNRVLVEGVRFRTFAYPRVAKQSLPKPPVPELQKTMSKYLEYVQVISSDPEYRQTEQYVNHFLSNDGPWAQDKLQGIAAQNPNWVNIFWLPDMYLNNRICLPINSNPAYIFPRRHFDSNDDLINYAACLVRGVCSFKELVDKRAVPVDKSTGKEKVSLCMDQYWRIFSSYREPSFPRDLLDTSTHRVNNENGEHIIVMCNNQAFILRTVVEGERLSHSEIALQLGQCIQMANSRPQITVQPVGLITSAQRDKAATATQILLEDIIEPTAHIADATNRTSLEWIRSSSFIVCLDLNAPKIAADAAEEEQKQHEALQIMHGCGPDAHGCNRWYDKTLQFIVGDNGVSGVNIEHSVAEGVVLITMTEMALRYVEQNLKCKPICAPQKRMKPKLLTWHIDDQLKHLLAEIKADYENICKDVDLEVFIYRGYGREYAKSKSMSPDVYIQLILQLAHYRTHGCLVSTYESASVRRFREGRVDNIRSATPEALVWVKVMDDPGATQEVKKKAFDLAVKKQTAVMIENVSGQGIDNHLVALREICKEHAKSGNMPEVFTDQAFREVMRFPLSTSQVATSIPDSFLCYGAVVDDGYGCSYNPKADEIVFVVSSFKSCAKTLSSKYKQALKAALDDTKVFLDSTR